MIRKISQRRSHTVIHEDCLLSTSDDQNLDNFKIFYPLNIFCLSWKDEERMRLNADQTFVSYNEQYSSIELELFQKKYNLLYDHTQNSSTTELDELFGCNYNIFDGYKGFFKKEYLNSDYLKAKLIFISKGGTLVPLSECNVFITTNPTDNSFSNHLPIFYLHYSWIINQFNSNKNLK